MLRGRFGGNLSICTAINRFATGATVKAVHVFCDCCSSSESKDIATKRGYKLRQCGNCGLIFVCPLPEPEHLAKLYRKTAGYFTTANTDLSETSQSYAINMSKVLSNNGIEAGRLLDVGCSTGAFIYHMRRLKWQVTGVEVNPDAVAVARQNHLDVVRGKLENCSFDEGSFDVIHMGDVIEHLSSPRETLRAAHRLLRKGGLIVIRTINAKCGFAVSSLLLAKIFRFPWPHSEAPYHLYDFYPKTLSRLLSGVGFEMVSLNCFGYTPFLYTVGATGFFDDLKSAMKKTGKYRFCLQLLKDIPKLALVAAILFPFYIWGTISDRLQGTGARILLIGRRR